MPFASISRRAARTAASVVSLVRRRLEELTALPWEGNTVTAPRDAGKRQEGAAPSAPVERPQSLVQQAPTERRPPRISLATLSAPVGPDKTQGLPMLLPIFLIVLVDIFALTLVIPLLAIYAEHLGATPFEATLLVSVFAVCQLVVRAAARPHLRSRRPQADADGQPDRHASSACWSWPAPARCGCSIWRASSTAPPPATCRSRRPTSPTTPTPENRARSFGLIGIAFGLGFFLGPSMTGYLSQFGLHAPIYAAAGLSLPSILCTALLLPNQRAAAATERRPTPDRGGERLGCSTGAPYAQYFERPVLAGLLPQFFLFGFAFTTFTSGFALFAERRSAGRAALHAARDRLPVRLRRLPRHHPAGRPDRPAGEALRRADAGGRGVHRRWGWLSPARRQSRRRSADRRRDAGVASARACCGRR